MRICVVGLGYIGLPTAAMLASRGHEVIGYDVNEGVVAAVNAGKPHFQEPDLQMLMTAAVTTGQLSASLQPVAADYFIIAVPTPVRAGGAPDMSYVDAAAAAIAPFVEKGATVILESTSPVGSTERLSAALAAARPDLSFPEYRNDMVEADVAVCHCPERILPGQMVRELVSNDRIIGGMTEACAQKALNLYQGFVTGACYITDCRVAEFSKLTENAYRDVNIAFANELSMICDRLDIDVWQVIELANKHPRVAILQPGPGVGGHCIAVDPWFIVHSAPEDARLIHMARVVNDEKPVRVVKQVAALADRFKEATVACYGVTYKPDVDDLRESPALEVIEALSAMASLKILVCDPFVTTLPKSLQGKSNVELVDAGRAQRDCDIAVFLVGHRPFRKLDPNQFLNKMVVDTIGLISKPNIQSH